MRVRARVRVWMWVRVRVRVRVGALASADLEGVAEGDNVRMGSGCHLLKDLLLSDCLR